MDKFCGTCMKQSNQMNPLSVLYEENFPLLELMFYLIGTPDNLKPYHRICESCESSLVSAYFFKKKCLDTDAIFMEMYKTTSKFRVDIDSFKHKLSTFPRKIELKTSQRFENDIKLVDVADSILQSNGSIVKRIDQNENAEDRTHPDRDHSIQVKCDPNTQKGAIDQRKSCRICCLSFPDVKSYLAHHRQVHQKQTLCPFCGKLVAKDGMEKHLISHSKTKNHLCMECGKRFTLSENLKKHLRIQRYYNSYKSMFPM